MSHAFTPILGRRLTTPVIATLPFRSSSDSDDNKLLLHSSYKVSDGGGGALHGILYGTIGLVCLLPTLVSYAHIIFNSPQEFQEFMPMIIKMLFLSSALHQLLFTVRSSMPFAVGQIQDVGLIFLSAIVRDVVKTGQEEGLLPAEIVATSLWLCATSTFIVGLIVVGVGKAKLTEYVQLIPFPVIGGYLGYIGYFSLAAGFSMTTGEYISGPETLSLLFNWDYAVKLTVMVSVIILLVIGMKCGGTFTMPAILTLVPVLFFMVLFVTGNSVLDAQELGWLAPKQPTASGIAAIKLYDPTLVDWSLFPRQIPNLLSLAVVVIFGSALDIAAVQAEYDCTLDFNNEMETVGYANMLSGIFGGFTGSYIFSQTIFNLRVKVGSKWQGAVVVVGELVVFAMAYDTQQVLPLVYIGAIMGFFGCEIMYDWLIVTRALVSHVEFVLLWVSFVCILILSGESSIGILAGMCLSSLLSAVVFACHYARVRTWRQVHTVGSSVARNFEQTRILTITRDQKIFSARIRGYVFFGSVVDIRRLQYLITSSTADFIIIDFARCDGLDSTAAAAFGTLKNVCITHKIELVVTSAFGEVGSLLQAHGVISADRRDEMLTMDDALVHCEDILVGQIFTGHHELYEHLLTFVSYDASQFDVVKKMARSLSMYFETKYLVNGELLFRHSESADSIFLIIAGGITVSYPKAEGHRRVRKVRAGTFLGEVAAFGTGCHAFDACASGNCTIGVISREMIQLLETEAPDLLLFFHRILLRKMSSVVQSLENSFE